MTAEFLVICYHQYNLHLFWQNRTNLLSDVNQLVATLISTISENSIAFFWTRQSRVSCDLCQQKNCIILDKTGHRQVFIQMWSYKLLASLISTISENSIAFFLIKTTEFLMINIDSKALFLTRQKVFKSSMWVHQLVATLISIISENSICIVLDKAEQSFSWSSSTV